MCGRLCLKIDWSQGWSDLVGTRLRWLAGYLVKLLIRSPFGRTSLKQHALCIMLAWFSARSEEVAILKKLYFRVNNLEFPTRSNSNSSVGSEAACYTGNIRGSSALHISCL